jgi:hypothetical protein
MKNKTLYYTWSKKEDLRIREFFFVVTGIDPKPLYNKKRTHYIFATDMLREIENQALLLSNYKTIRILEEMPKNWKNHYENDIIGCVDFVEHLPLPNKYKGRILRVDRQKKFFQLKERKGLYLSDGTVWKRVARLPKRKRK